MKRYLLDTSVLVGYFNGRRGAVELVQPWLINREAATSLLVVAEAIEHLKGQPDFSALYGQLRRILREIAPFDLTYPILERYADVRRSLRPPHGPGLIGDIDTLIAATAIERTLTIVTTDEDFRRVPSRSIMLLDRRELGARS